jgi:glutamate-1-semialdehyde 2,1-aminomutase
MGIVEVYQQRHQRSAALYAQAQQHVPSGITHDARFILPFPLYVERSNGAHKWDADENEVIDFVTGHGALLLGHGHPQVVAAVQEQMARGTHYGAEHSLTIRWATLVQQIFPSIERLRFVASGTEATQMALRLARAFTGKPTVLRLFSHYHGWHDGLAYGMEGDLTPPIGLPEAALALTVPLPMDLDTIQQTLETRDDIAALIVEPTGASYGTVPFPAGFLVALRELTTAHDVLLICDEVVTGFRVAGGGAQQRAGIRADLTTLAKVLAGGLPGGAVGGRADIMEHLAFSNTAKRKIRHNGTFNANPLSAVAGIATLEQTATGVPTAHADQLGKQLVHNLNEVFIAHQAAGWAAYGDGSMFHLIIDSPVQFAPGQLPADLPAPELKRGGNQTTLNLWRMALNNHGVDLMRGRSGFLSWAHTKADLDATCAAFDAALSDLAAEKEG